MARKKTPVAAARARESKWLRSYRKHLKAWLRVEGNSMMSLSRATHISPPALRDWREGRHTPRIGNAYLVEEVLGMEL